MRPIPRKTLFVDDVSINWATRSKWQTKAPETWKVSQLSLLRQESVLKLVFLYEDNARKGWPSVKAIGHNETVCPKSGFYLNAHTHQIV